MKTKDKKRLPRIAAFDLDGTVLNNGLMSPAVREALFALRRSGVAVVVASGRDLAQIRPEIMECFSFAVAANGAYLIYNSDGSFITRSPMDAGLAALAVKTILKHRGGPSLFLCGKMAAALRSPLCMPGGSVAAYRKTAADYCPNLILTSRLEAFARSGKKPVYKIQGFFRNPADCSAAAAELMKHEALEVLDMRNGTIEVTMRGVTKAAGLKTLCEILGFSTNELAAFGDSRNDLDMLRAAGYAVAMANGDDCVKEIAYYVAEDVTCDGAAKAIYDIFGIGEDDK